MLGIFGFGTCRMKYGTDTVPTPRPGGGVVTQRTATPCTQVRFLSWPPFFLSIPYSFSDYTSPPLWESNGSMGRMRGRLAAPVLASILSFDSLLFQRLQQLPTVGIGVPQPPQHYPFTLSLRHH